MRLRLILSFLLPAATAMGQQPDRAIPTLAVTRADGVPSSPAVTGTQSATMQPSWETQKGARTYVLGIPAPRGQIVDRNGVSLAQTRISYNLGIAFPTPLEMKDPEVRRYAERQIMLARQLTGRIISIQEEQLLKHYRNRGVLPLFIANDLKPHEVERIRQDGGTGLALQPVYMRWYPQGGTAGHIVGYAGRAGRYPDKVLENNDLLWPESEGREGLEQMFNDQLTGKVGQMNIALDAAGKKVTEQIIIPPQPGFNIVTTIDIKLQELCEDALSKGAKRGAMVITEPNSGDILAMASWPGINPNWFVPSISQEDFDRLRNDSSNPLIPRAFRSSYPPGSTFKVFVGLAALQSGKIRAADEFSCPPSMEIGRLTFRNWKKTHAGNLNFADALIQSCNPYFYQAGLKIGAAPIVDTSQRLGLGMRTGIPIASETSGRVPTEEFMLKTHNRRFSHGDIANISIGQGDLLISPLQMAQAMGAIGNGGTLVQMRLVQQVQSVDQKVVTAYDPRARGVLGIDSKTMTVLRKAMAGVVSSRMGTAGRAAVPGVQMAGKTGTAQWGPKNNERTVAWFAGFIPAEQPRYAFAVVYEGDARNNDVHGGTQAGPIAGNVFREIYKDAKKSKKGAKPAEEIEEPAVDEDPAMEQMEQMEEDL
jgi:penicillin-binding protein 2